MDQPYIALLIYVILAIAVPVGMSILLAVVGPRKPDPAKYLPYESGLPTAPMAGRFPIKFYLIAMLFVIFDVEAASFYPWAVNLRGLGVFGLMEMLTFLVVLAIGYAYVWKKGGFSWR